MSIPPPPPPRCPQASPDPSLCVSPPRQRMEQMLSAFQCDLSSISSEIRTLQEQSVAMNLRLKNRRAVREQLGQLLDELVVPAAMIRWDMGDERGLLSSPWPRVTFLSPRSTILEAPVTEPEFLEQLQELNGKINSVKEQAFRETVACADVQHVLEKLKIKVRTPPPAPRGPLSIPQPIPVSPEGRHQDPGVRPAEDLLLPQAHDQLPDPPKRLVEV